LLNLWHQLDWHIYGSGLTCLLEGQLPRRWLSPGTPDFAQGAFHKQTDFPELPPIGIPEPMVPT
jgi:hypothetical protein